MHARERRRPVSYGYVAQTWRSETTKIKHLSNLAHSVIFTDGHLQLFDLEQRSYSDS